MLFYWSGNGFSTSATLDPISLWTNTMNRCINIYIGMHRCSLTRLLQIASEQLAASGICLGLSLVLGLSPQTVRAQAAAPQATTTSGASLLGTDSETAFERHFPPKAMRGRFTVTASPEVLLDGKADRLSPGARVRDVGNRVLLPASITGVRLPVNYVRDANGDLSEVWILSESEVKKVLPTMAAKRGFFGALFDTTPRQPTDDGNTPYDKLPKYK